MQADLVHAQRETTPVRCSHFEDGVLAVLDELQLAIGDAPALEGVTRHATDGLDKRLVG